MIYFFIVSMRENILIVLNNFNGQLHIIGICGILILIFSERKAILSALMKFFKRLFSDSKNSTKFIKRLVFILGLAIFEYACFYFLTNIITVVMSIIVIGFFAYYKRKTLRIFLISFLDKKTELFFTLKNLTPFLKRFTYIIGGYILIITSFSIVNNIIDLFFSPQLSPNIPQELNSSSNFWELLKFQSQFLSLFAVIGFIMTGVCLILSAGNKWLVNTAKLIATLNFIYIFISAFIYYA